MDYLEYEKFFPKLDESFQLLPRNKDGKKMLVFGQKDTNGPLTSIKSWMKETFPKLKNQQINDILHAFRKWYVEKYHIVD